ncbi:hypothetical protein BDV97DRAFT_375643 [Delphinella strobiligena]|nr:hypothetical protein BDV97DRAFT_375643 [Delphinella strobiligena]
MYNLTPTPHVPNSALPVLVYRAVLPLPHNQNSAKDALEKNNCIKVFSGSSRFLLGRGPLDDDAYGVEVELNAGDITVQPAGVAHCCLTSTDDFNYLGVYPKHSPKWDNNFCNVSAEETNQKAIVAHSIAIPDSDPIYGRHGPLVELWNKAATNASCPGSARLPARLE